MDEQFSLSSETLIDINALQSSKTVDKSHPGDNIFNELPILALVRPVQPEKAYQPIDVTEFGISILVRPLLS